MPEAIPESLVVKLREMHPQTSMALIGCYSKDIPRKSCEYDILLLSGDVPFVVESIINDYNLDLVYFPEERLGKTLTIDDRLLLSSTCIIHDPSMLLASFRSDHSQGIDLGHSTQELAFGGLARLSRAEDAYGKGKYLEARFWLMSSAYTLCRCLLLETGADLSPSHLISEMRRRRPNILGEDLLQECLAFQLASAVTISRRLEALKRLVECIPAIKSSFPFVVGGFDNSLLQSFGYTRIKHKSSHMLKEHLTVEAFSYIGYELARFIESYYLLACDKAAVSPLWSNVFEEICGGRLSATSPGNDFTKLIGLNVEGERTLALVTYLKNELRLLSIDSTLKGTRASSD